MSSIIHRSRGRPVRPSLLLAFRIARVFEASVEEVFQYEL
jgi:DNA-binding XRE family transcriptional regulator